MIGELVYNIYKPAYSEDWFIIETERNKYSLRLGGFKKVILSDAEFSKYIRMQPNNYTSVRVKEVYSDSEWLYIILENNFVIASGWVSIDPDGEATLGVQFKHKRDYDSDFFAEDIFRLTANENGDSIHL